jgi:hypothetical protein
MKIADRLLRLEKVTPQRGDTAAEVERLQALLLLRLSGIASRRKSAPDYVPRPRMTPEERAALWAAMNAHLAALCPHPSPGPA